MDNEFKELKKENLPSGYINSGKIIKAKEVKVNSNSRKVSNSTIKTELEKKSQSDTINKDKLFTIEPKYNEDIIEELNVSCSCGNNTRIIFNNEEETSEIENDSIPEK